MVKKSVCNDVELLRLDNMEKILSSADGHRELDNSNSLSTQVSGFIFFLVTIFTHTRHFSAEPATKPKWKPFDQFVGHSSVLILVSQPMSSGDKDLI